MRAMHCLRNLYIIYNIIYIILCNIYNIHILYNIYIYIIYVYVYIYTYIYIYTYTYERMTECIPS